MRKELGGQGAVAVHEHLKHRGLGQHGTLRPVGADLDGAAGPRPLARNRDFLASLAGRCASRFGDKVAVVTLTLRLQSAGARPYLIALLLAAGLVPMIAAARLAGQVADSVDSRRVLVAAALGAVLNTASVGSLAAGGALAAVLAPRQVYLLAGAMGCAVTAVLAARLGPAAAPIFRSRLNGPAPSVSP